MTARTADLVLAGMHYVSLLAAVVAIAFGPGFIAYWVADYLFTWCNVAPGFYMQFSPRLVLWDIAKVVTAVWWAAIAGGIFVVARGRG